MGFLDLFNFVSSPLLRLRHGPNFVAAARFAARPPVLPVRPMVDHVFDRKQPLPWRWVLAGCRPFHPYRPVEKPPTPSFRASARPLV
jgi:hypothetical protein